MNPAARPRKRGWSTLSWRVQLLLSVTSGCAVATVVALSRHFWSHRTVPRVLSRSVRRDRYLAAVYEMSETRNVRSLDVLAPRLTAARGSDLLTRIQNTWARGSSLRIVRIITGATETCLTGGVELLRKGLDVRVVPSLESDQLSYHVFDQGTQATVIVNRHERDRDLPVRLDGIAPSGVFRSHFEGLWRSAVPIESILARRILQAVGPNATRADILRKVKDLSALHRLDNWTRDRMMLHLALLDSASTVFIVGLPGAGKSLLRRYLAEHLCSLRMQVVELSDYPYIYGDFVRSMIRLDGDRANRFSAELGGAFRVDDEEVLRPALRALAERVWANHGGHVVTIVEFARANISEALREFGDLLSSSQVIYVEASPDRRRARLSARAIPPTLHVTDRSVDIGVSDDHLLPREAINDLYNFDDFQALCQNKNLADRLHRFVNDDDKEDREAIESWLRRLVELVCDPYNADIRPPRGPKPTSRKGLPRAS